MKKFLFLALMMASVFSLYCQKTVKVCGDYTYYPPENITVEKAKNIAVERAKIKALEDEFGSIMSQSNTTVTKNSGEISDVNFYFLGGSEVKGDWIEDIEVNVKPSYIDGTLIINSHVCGKARAITSARVDLDIHTLCNGTESSNYKSGDLFSVKFKSPVSGYLAVFFLDPISDKVYCLLPYTDGVARAVKSRTEYTFFCSKDPLYSELQEDMFLEADTDLDMNHLFFVFSTNSFNMPLTDDGEISTLSFENYNKWIQKNKIKDAKIQVEEKIVEIRK